MVEVVTFSIANQLPECITKHSLDVRMYKHLLRIGERTRKQLVKRFGKKRSAIWDSLERLMTANLVDCYNRKVDKLGRPPTYFIVHGHTPKYKVSPSRKVKKLKEWHDPRIWMLELLQQTASLNMKQLQDATGLYYRTLLRYARNYLLPAGYINCKQTIEVAKKTLAKYSRNYYSITSSGKQLLGKLHLLNITRWSQLRDANFFK